MASKHEIAAYVRDTFSPVAGDDDFLQISVPIQNTQQVVNVGIGEDVIWLTSFFSKVSSFDLGAALDSMDECLSGVTKLDEFYATCCALFIDPKTKIKEWRKDPQNSFVRAVTAVAGDAKFLSELKNRKGSPAQGDASVLEKLDLHQALMSGSASELSLVLSQHEACILSGLCSECEELAEDGEYVPVLAAANPKIDAKAQEKVWELASSWQGMKLDVALTLASNPAISRESKIQLLDFEELIEMGDSEEWFGDYFHDLLNNPKVKSKELRSSLENVRDYYVYDDFVHLVS